MYSPRSHTRPNTWWGWMTRKTVAKWIQSKTECNRQTTSRCREAKVIWKRLRTSNLKWAKTTDPKFENKFLSLLRKIIITSKWLRSLITRKPTFIPWVNFKSIRSSKDVPNFSTVWTTLREWLKNLMFLRSITKMI